MPILNVTLSFNTGILICHCILVLYWHNIFFFISNHLINFFYWIVCCFLNIFSTTSQLIFSNVAIFFIFFNWSFISRRIFRTDTLASSPIFLTSLTRSFLRSSVKAGTAIRITSPSLVGLTPKLAAIIAFRCQLQKFCRMEK